MELLMQAYFVINTLLWAFITIYLWTKAYYSVTYQYKTGTTYFNEMAVVQVCFWKKPETNAKKVLSKNLKEYDPEFSGLEIVEIRKIEVL